VACKYVLQKPWPVTGSDDGGAVAPGWARSRSSAGAGRWYPAGTVYTHGDGATGIVIFRVVIVASSTQLDGEVKEPSRLVHAVVEISKQMPWM
jgi:hypothetical protein